MKYNVKDYLRICFALTEKKGYYSYREVGKKDATFFVAKNIYKIVLGSEEDVESFDYYNSILKELDLSSNHLSRLISDSYYWINKVFNSKSEYFETIKGLLDQEEIDESSLPVLASFPNTYLRIQKEANYDSNFVGNVGDTVTVTINTFKEKGSYYTEYGEVVVYEFTDYDNNIYIWKTSKYISKKPDTIKGKIKSHDTYNGVKQNILTRCQII